MLFFVRDIFYLSFKTALKRNQNELKHHATAVPLPQKFLPINLMQGNVFLRALHLTLAQVISGRQIELPLVT